MTAYNGTTVISGIGEDAWRPCAAINIANVTTVSPVSEMRVIEQGVDTLTNITYNQNSPIPELEQSYIGENVDSFLQDYYYRIHISPSNFEFGAVLNTLEEDVLVWNAWFSSKVCSTINETSPDEFEWSGLTPAFSLPSLGYTNYIITVPDIGSVEFVATLSWVFPDETSVLTMRGTRLRVFPFEPKIPQQESYEWATDILKAKVGSEQRISKRRIPRQGFQFNVYLKDEQEQARLDALLFTWGKRAWGIPVWSEWQSHASTINIDDEVIYFSTEYYDFYEGGYGVIWQNFDSYEAFKIVSIDSGGGVTLDSPIKSTWSGLKWIMPLRAGIMLSPSQLKETADGYANFSCRFIITDNVLLPSYVAPVTYLGLPVLSPSIEIDGLDNNIEADIQLITLDSYKFSAYSSSDYNVYGQDHIFRNEGVENCWEFKKFLYYLSGRLKTVWRPTYKHDFKIIEKIGAAETTAKVDTVGWAENMGLNNLRKHIAFIFKDGSIMCREITGITEAAGYDTLSFDSSLGLEVFPEDAEISLLDLCRLTSDKVEVTWEESFSNTCRLNFTKVTQ